MPRGNLQAVLLCAAVTLFSINTQAACDTGGTQCPPETVADNTTSVTNTYHLNFATNGQNMWRSGADDTGKSDSFVLLDRSTAAFGRPSPYTAGSIRRYCFYNELRDLLDDVNILGYSMGTVVDAFRDEFSNPCYSFGGRISSDFEGGAGLSMNLVSESGSVSVAYPLALEMTVPGADKYMPGDTIEIGIAASTRPGLSLSTTSPDGSLGMSSAADMELHTQVSGCIDDCESRTLVGPYDVDVSQNSSMAGAAGLSYELETFSPLDMLNNPPTAILNFLAGSTGTVGIPKVDASTSSLDGNGRSLTARGADTFTDLAIDLDLWLSRLAGSFFSLTSKSLSFNSVSIQSSSIDSTVNVRTTYNQEFVFDPTFYVEITFPVAVNWSVVDGGGSTLRSGNGSLVTLQPGQRIRVDSTPFTDVTAINARAYQRNQFRNNTSVSTDSSLDMYALRYRFNTPRATIFNSRCIDLVLGEICTPRMSWPGSSLNWGPLYQQDGIGQRNINYPVSNASWELQGFQSFPLQSMMLDPNQLPRSTRRVSDKILKVSRPQTLNLAQIFSDPDGNPLSYTLSFPSGDTPPVEISQEDGTMELLATSPFSSTQVQLTASDGNGGTVTATFHIRALPLTIPALPLPAYAVLSLLLLASARAALRKHSRRLSGTTGR